MAERTARTIALVEHHARYWPDAAAAAAEVARVVGGEPEIFLLVDREGAWEAACAAVDPSFRPSRWVQVRGMPAGEYGLSELHGFTAERLLRRADTRPGFLVSLTEAPSGEGEYEPGGETFGISTRVGDHAGLRRLGVNLDVIRPGARPPTSAVPEGAGSPSHVSRTRRRDTWPMNVAFATTSCPT